MSRGGWEKCAHPAERAVALMQAGSNWGYVERLERRFGEGIVQELLDAGVVRLLPKVGVVILEPPLSVPDQWQLEAKRLKGAAWLRREIRRRQQLRRRWRAREADGEGAPA